MEIIKRFLEGSVVIPYSSDLLSLIKEACHAYISEDEEDKYADIEKMAECFLWGIGAEDFQSILNDTINNENTICVTIVATFLFIQRLCSSFCRLCCKW